MKIKSNKALVIGATLASFAMAAPAFAGTYVLNCVNAHSNQPTKLTIEASSRSAAIEKARNDLEYADYDKCS